MRRGSWITGAAGVPWLLSRGGRLSRRTGAGSGEGPPRLGLPMECPPGGDVGVEPESIRQGPSGGERGGSQQAGCSSEPVHKHFTPKPLIFLKCIPNSTVTHCLERLRLGIPTAPPCAMCLRVRVPACPCPCVAMLQGFLKDEQLLCVPVGRASWASPDLRPQSECVAVKRNTKGMAASFVCLNLFHLASASLLWIENEKIVH